MARQTKKNYRNKSKIGKRKLRQTYKNKKIRKKYLGGLHHIQQGDRIGVGNCRAHAFARCIYRICKDYEVIVPDTNEPIPNPKSGDYPYNEYIKITSQVERKRVNNKNELSIEDFSEISKDENITFDQYNKCHRMVLLQRTVYFTLLPIINYWFYFKLGGDDELFNYYPLKISDSNINKIINDQDKNGYFYGFNRWLKNVTNDVYRLLSEDSMFKIIDEQTKQLKGKSPIDYDKDEARRVLIHQLDKYNKLLHNITTKLGNKYIYMRYYGVDEYLETHSRNDIEVKNKIYGMIRIKRNYEIMFPGTRNKYPSFFSFGWHIMPLTSIKENENNTNNVDVTFKNSWLEIKDTHTTTENIEKRHFRKFVGSFSILGFTVK